MREPDIHFAPTPSRVIFEMLRLAEIGPGSVVYNLVCGDGRVLTAAARIAGRAESASISMPIESPNAAPTPSRLACSIPGRHAQ
jgi:hypothetical protein